MVDLDVREDKILKVDQVSPLMGVKMMTLRLVQDRGFETFQIDDNLARPVRVGSGLSTMVKTRLVECLKSNVKLFIIFPDKISGIDLSVACHQLNIDSSARYVAHRIRR